ncbi:MAG: hypothetical protein HXY50_06590 [Ignavibacteriaceae bacterium]|nr:hypothetical protein [Ignavibacteriaceae bacterium]
MKFYNLFFEILLSKIFFVIFTLGFTLHAQPYYFYEEMVSDNYDDIYRVNLSNGEKILFIEDVRTPFSFTTDNYQHWFFLFAGEKIFAYRPETSTIVDSISPFGDYEYGLSAFSINSLNQLFLSWLENLDESMVLNTYLLDLNSLQIIKSCSASIESDAIISKSGHYIYLLARDSLGINYFEKYSIELDSIVDKKYFFEINNEESLFFDDGKKGMVLLSYNETEHNNTPRYFVYDVDNNLYFPGISFHHRSHGYLSPNSDFIILQKAPWVPERPHAELINGYVSLYKVTTGELVMNLQLPPDGKLLLFDSYPDKLFYYVPETQQAITINLSELHTGLALTTINPSTSNVNSGSFMMNVRGQGFDSLAVLYFNGQARATTFISDSVLTADIPTSDVSVAGAFPVWVKDEWAISDTLQFTVQASSPNLLVNLKSSTGILLTTGSLQYYEGSWKDAVNNGDGTFTVITNQNNVSLRMTYEYAQQTVSNIPAHNNTYTFQTVSANVQLRNSQGSLIDTGTVQYYAGAWRSFGTTTNGVAIKELLPLNYSFRMTYAYASIDKPQNLSTDPIVVFQTVNAEVRLKNSFGNFLGVGTVQYYAGAWRSFGTTTNGVAAKELLPLNYSFRMTYEFASIDKQQNISVDPTVVFQTVNAQVQLKNSLGNLIDAGTVQYYAGAWRNFGTTTNGVATKELLPINYSFRMTHAFLSKDKQQNLSTNPVVEFATVLCTVKVSNTNNQPLNNANVKYYAGSWRDFGITNTEGITTKELLPQNISFRASYGSASQDKQQDITNNNLVEFLLNVP